MPSPPILLLTLPPSHSTPNYYLSSFPTNTGFLSVSRIRKIYSCHCAFVPTLASAWSTHSPVVGDWLLVIHISTQMPSLWKTPLRPPYPHFLPPTPFLILFLYGISNVWNYWFIFYRFTLWLFHWNITSLRVHSSRLEYSKLFIHYLILSLWYLSEREPLLLLFLIKETEAQRVRIFFFFQEHTSRK